MALCKCVFIQIRGGVARVECCVIYCGELVWRAGYNILCFLEESFMVEKKKMWVAVLALFLAVSMVLAGCKKPVDGGTTGPTVPDKGQQGLQLSDVAMDPDGHVGKALENTFGGFGNVFAGPAGVLEKVQAERGEIVVEIADVFMNKLMMDSETGVIADSLTIYQDGEALEFEVDISGNEVALIAPSVFGDTVYGVNLDTLLDDLKASAIWELMGTTYEEFMAEFEGTYGDLVGKVSEVDPEKAEEVMKNLEREIKKTLRKVSRNVESKRVAVDGKEVLAIQVSYVMTAAELKELVDVLVDWTEETLLAFGVEEDMFVDSLDGTNLFDATRSSLEAVFAELDLNGALTVSIHPLTGKVMMLELDADVTYQEESVSFDALLTLGEKPEKSERYVLDVAVDDGVSVTKLQAVVTSSDDENAFKGALNLGVKVLSKDEPSEDGSESILDEAKIDFTLEYDKNTGKYSLRGDNEGSTIEICGCYQVAESSFQLSVDTLAVDGEVDTVGLKVSAKVMEGYKLVMPEYVNPLLLPKDELEALLGSFTG